MRIILSPIMISSTLSNNTSVSFKGNSDKDIALMHDIVVISKKHKPVLEKKNEDSTLSITEMDSYKNLIKLTERNSGNHNIDENEIRESIEARANVLTKSFTDNTYGKFISDKTTNSDKSEIFEQMLNYLANNININNFEDAITRKNSIYAENSIREIFKEARKIWKEKELPNMLNTEILKMCMIEELIYHIPQLKTLAVFENLSLDNRAFIALYYKNNKYSLNTDSDSMYRILTDRTIQDKEEIIDEIRIEALGQDKNLKNMVNEAPQLFITRYGIEKLNNFFVTKDKNLLNLYLEAFDNPDPLDDEELYDFLKTVDDNSLEQANQFILNKWNKTYLKRTINAIVDDKAYKTDIRVKTLEELKNINENLTRISVTLDGIKISLVDLINKQSSITAQLNNPDKSATQLNSQSSLLLEGLRNRINSNSVQQNEELMQIYKTQGLDFLDLISARTNDPNAKNMIADLKTNIIRAKQPNQFLARLEGYGTMYLMNKFLYGGGKVAAMTGRTVATGAAESGLMAAIDPVTATIAITALGFYGMHKAHQINKTYTDMYFGE